MSLMTSGSKIVHLTDDPAAKALLADDANALLIGIVLDQGAH